MNAFFGLIIMMTMASPQPIPLSQAAPAVPAAKAAEKAIDPALDMLGRLVGGTWRTTGAFVAEFKYEWRVKGKAVRGLGVIAKGTKDEFPSEALYGWDPDAKKVYYLDFHGHETIYKGWAEAKDGKFTGDFAGLIGDKGHYRFESEMPDDDTLVSTLLGQNEKGEWVKLHSLTFKRIQ